MTPILNKNIFKSKIFYSIINDSRIWSKRIKKVRKIIDSILKNYEYFTNSKYKYYNFTFLFTDDKRLRKLNTDYKNKTKTTDVLTFTSYQKINNRKITRFCDIAISGKVIKNDSKKLKVNFYDHLSHIIVHALLHSNNYTHHNKKNFNKMKSIETIILRKLNIENPYNIL